VGRMAERQSLHTGRREMFVRGIPQSRQSDENRVAKRLSATPFT